MRVAGLFAGIGGIELGFQRAGHEASLLCEIDEGARAVLGERFPEARLVDDVRSVAELPDDVDVLTAGFPCQDLSSVGGKAGLAGDKSSLVGEVFRLLERTPVEWVVVENVRFMLHLAKGAAMAAVVGEFERLGYRWAYRLVDSLGFGVPQRRHRVYFVASRNHDPGGVLFADEAGTRRPVPPTIDRPTGFYWTEGTYAAGLTADGVPPLKGGSTIGIPSPPAILFPDGHVGTPNVRDAERLQGFPAGWTEPAEAVARASFRWRMIGNAVTVPVAEWLGGRLATPADWSAETERLNGGKWPDAAWFDGRRRHAVASSTRPVATRRVPLERFLRFPTKPLSLRATRGFLKRARSGRLRFPEGFLEALDEHAAAHAVVGVP